MKRRDFIRTSAIMAPAMSLFPADLSFIKRESAPGKIEKRSLGKTGEMLSMIGFGGIVVRGSTSTQASDVVKLAIDAGVNYFDVAPSYGDAEAVLGPALEPYRKGVFLTCKTTERTKTESREELERSLKNLRTGHFDLYLHHALQSVDEVNTIFGPGGSMETFLEARKEGKIRFLGFSAHSVESAMAMMDHFDFDVICFPVNYACWNAGNFGLQLLARAQEKNMGIVAIKAMAKGLWPQGADHSKYQKCWYEPLTSLEDIEMGPRFTLSHPVTLAVPPGEEELFRIALSLRDKLKPLTNQEVETIKAKALKSDPLFRYPMSFPPGR
jgi:aryl-alcohol dehydrogenase-like predicted oxidoreductase